jgi:HPt (histidine-containing phosphotransfer) domain-containing protein
LTSQPQVQAIREHLATHFNLSFEQVDALLPSFIDTLGKHMRALEEALGSKDPLLLGKAAHTIKGAFMNLGMDECAHLALKLEEEGRSGGSLSQSRQLVEELRGHLAPLLK